MCAHNAIADKIEPLVLGPFSFVLLPSAEHLYGANTTRLLCMYSGVLTDFDYKASKTFEAKRSLD